LRGNMTGTNKRGLLTATCWIVLGVVISLWSSTFPFGTLDEQGPAIFPLGCGLVLILLGIILLIQERKGDHGKALRSVPGLMPRGTAAMRVTSVLGGMLLAAVLFDVLGFLLTVFCLVLCMMRVSQPQKWKVDLSYSLVFTLGSYLLFHMVLKTTLPKGLLGF
jgi:putative tricarboxylic transport membrane protein